MRQIRIGLMSILTAALLAACGGGGEVTVPGTVEPAGAPTTKASFSTVVSFGDSLSDVGSYAPATVHPLGPPPANYIGGKFTTNLDGQTPLGQNPLVWIEVLAALNLGIAVTPAEMGFNKASVACPVPAVAGLAGTCTGYGQGGAMITSARGYGQAADGSGPLAVPVVTQIANHLARFGSFKDSDLIVVWAGHNELFSLLDPRLPDSFAAAAISIRTAAGAAATQIQADAAAGKITADEAQRQLAEITAEASRQLFHAQTVAQQTLKTASQELTGYIRDQILAKGGKYVVVMTMVDTAITPEGLAQDNASRQFLTMLADTFNLWLRDGLANQPVKIIDVNPLLRLAVDNPAQYNFTNVTEQACDNDKIQVVTGGQVTDGSPLFCNGTPGVAYNTLRSGRDAQGWFFADEVHPSAGGHRFIADRVAEQLASFGWI